MVSEAPFPPCAASGETPGMRYQAKSLPGHDEGVQQLGNGPTGPSNSKPTAQWLQHPPERLQLSVPAASGLCKVKLLQEL